MTLDSNKVRVALSMSLIGVWDFLRYPFIVPFVENSLLADRESIMKSIRTYDNTRIAELLGPAETQYVSVPCSQLVSGGDTPQTYAVDMGATSATFNFYWETYVVEDRLIVRYQGNVLFDSGCVGDGNTETLNFSGSSSLITVEVQPSCTGPGSAVWEFEVSCPRDPD